MHKLSISCAIVISFVLTAKSATAALINTYSGPGPIYTSNIITTRSSSCCGLESIALVNGNGFAGGTPPNFLDANLNNIPEHFRYESDTDGSWLADNSVNPASSQWVSFDLGATFYVEKMRVWNYEQNAAVNRSTGTANIWYSTDASPGLPVGPAANPALSGWTQLGVGPHAFQNPATVLSYDTVDDIVFPSFFGGIYVRHVLIDIVTSHGDQYVGLAEVQFFSTTPAPEPSTFALLSLGIVGLAVRRRRNRTKA